MQLEKVLPVAMITAQVARLGAANRKLLEVLCGSWVAILQCWRRAMCLLETVFSDIQEYDYGVTFALSPQTVDELWSLVTMAPLFTTDLRAEVCPELSFMHLGNGKQKLQHHWNLPSQWNYIGKSSQRQRGPDCYPR